MELSLPVVWSDDCLLHKPAAEIWVGVRTPATEGPVAVRETLLGLEEGRP